MNRKTTRREFIKLAMAGGASVFGSACQLKKPFMLLLPFTHGSSYPLVIYHHGSSENAQSIKNDPKGGIIAALRANGYLIAAHDARGNNWGSPLAVSDYADLRDYVIAQYRVNKIVFLTQSMGGLTGLTAMADPRFAEVKGCYGIYPVCNLRASYDLNFGSVIRSVYGIAGDGSDYDSKTAGSDPVLKAAADFLPVRYRFTASDGDTVVPKAPHSDQFATLLQGRAVENEVMACTGDHGHGSHFLPQDVLDFFARC